MVGEYVSIIFLWLADACFTILPLLGAGILLACTSLFRMLTITFYWRHQQQDVNPNPKLGIFTFVMRTNGIEHTVDYPLRRDYGRTLYPHCIGYMCHNGLINFFLLPCIFLF